MAIEACPFTSDSCKYFYKEPVVPDEEVGCFSDVHHLYHPAAKYRSGAEKKFRELPDNKIVVCRKIHDELHAEIEAPTKPKRPDMYRALGGVGLRNDYTDRVEEFVEDMSIKLQE